MTAGTVVKFRATSVGTQGEAKRLGDSTIMYIMSLVPNLPTQVKSRRNL